jgi:phospholipid transport system substrate-binding protein
MWRRRGLLAIFAMAVVVSAPLAAETVDPAAFVATFVERGTAIAREHPAADAMALQEWQALLHDGLDVPAIARFVVGPQAWQRANGTQRSELIGLIEQALAAFYARRVRDEPQASLAVLGSETLGPQEWLVTSRVTRADGSAAMIDWRLRQGAEGLRILDIVADGDSLAAAKRTEYTQILQRNGGNVDGLIRTLRSHALDDSK